MGVIIFIMSIPKYCFFTGSEAMKGRPNYKSLKSYSVSVDVTGKLVISQMKLKRMDREDYYLASQIMDHRNGYPTLLYYNY